MDTAYAQAFRNNRSGGQDKRHAWGSLAPGGAGSFETHPSATGHGMSGWGEGGHLHFPNSAPLRGQIQVPRVFFWSSTNDPPRANQTTHASRLKNSGGGGTRGGGETNQLKVLRAIRKHRSSWVVCSEADNINKLPVIPKSDRDRGRRRGTRLQKGKEGGRERERERERAGPACVARRARYDRRTPPASSLSFNFSPSSGVLPFGALLSLLLKLRTSATLWVYFCFLRVTRRAGCYSVT